MSNRKHRNTTLDLITVYFGDDDEPRRFTATQCARALGLRSLEVWSALAEMEEHGFLRRRPGLPVVYDAVIPS